MIWLCAQIWDTAVYMVSVQPVGHTSSRPYVIWLKRVDHESMLSMLWRSIQEKPEKVTNQVCRGTRHFWQMDQGLTTWQNKSSYNQMCRGYPLVSKPKGFSIKYVVPSNLLLMDTIFSHQVCPEHKSKDMIRDQGSQTLATMALVGGPGWLPFAPAILRNEVGRQHYPNSWNKFSLCFAWKSNLIILEGGDHSKVWYFNLNYSCLH